MTDRNRRVSGLVVVSHSRALARAAVALAGEMLHGRPIRIEIAAGLDDTTFGTDAVSIKEAIERVDGPAGVVVLMDLGSAVLSAELALDLLADPSVRDRVTLSPAPIVEGLIVAAVAAAGWGQPRGGGGRGPRRADGQGRAPVVAGRSRCGRRARPGRGRRDRRCLHCREPPRAACPAGVPAGQRGPRSRRLGAAAQPDHRRRTGAGRQPEPGRDAGRAAGPRGGGPCLRSAGPGGGRAPAHPRAALVRRARGCDPDRPGAGSHGLGRRPTTRVPRDRDRTRPQARLPAGRRRRRDCGGTVRRVAADRRVRRRRPSGDRAPSRPHRPRGRPG